MLKRILVTIGGILLIILSYYYCGPLAIYGIIAVIGLIFVVSTTEKLENRNSKLNYQRNKVSIIEHKFLNSNIEEFDTDKDGIIMINELYPLTEEEVVKKILENDKSFKKENFDLYVRKVFRSLMNAYSKNNANIIRPYESNSLFFQDKYIIEEYINNDFSRNIENLRIKGTLIKDYKVEGVNEIIVVALSAKLKDYVINKKDKIIIIGDNRKQVDNTYFMTFIRKKEKFKTLFDINNNECPNCGSKLNLDDKGTCDYCHTSLVLGEYYWVLVDIKNIRL